MFRSVPLVTVLVAVSLLILAGCGGSTGGTPMPPGSTASTQQVFVLDFVHRTVTTAVQAQFVERNPGQAAADLALTITFPPVDPGTPGREQITATVKNNTTGPVGANDLGTITGIDLCFTKTVFKNASAATVPGGGYAGYSSLTPVTNTAIYNLPQSLAAGATSQGALVSVMLPPTATTATVTVIVHATTAFVNPPDLTRWYLSTLAGQSTAWGYRDGAASQAQFCALQGSLYRDDVGDVLVADSGCNRVRRIYQGQVTTFAGTGWPDVCAGPDGLGRDAAGNIYISETQGHCVSLAPAGGGTPTVIAGTRGTNGDNSDCRGSAALFGTLQGLAVSGNQVYVCDNGKVKMLSYNGYGNRFDPTSWYVTDISNAAGFSGPTGVAADALGNVYVTDFVTGKIYVLAQGSSTWTVIAGRGVSSEIDGTGLGAAFYLPTAIAADQAGYLYVVDLFSSLRSLRHTGGLVTNPATWVVSTLVPTAAASVDGFTGTGKVHSLNGVSCAGDGTLYLAEGSDLRRLDRTRN
jgi:hypothetical protein